MDYWLKLENIEIEYVPGQKQVKVCNYNKDRIEGLAFVCHGSEVYVNGNPPSSRRINDEVIFWFDIDGMRYTLISNDMALSIGEGALQGKRVIDPVSH